MKKKFRDEILKRAMLSFDCRFVKDFAMLFNMSPQNLNGYIQRDTFIDLIKPEAIKRGIDINWIKNGEGKMKPWHGTGTPIAEPHAPYNANSSAPRISDLLSKTAAVLESPTIFSNALKANIEAFHTAVTCEEQLAVASKRIDDLEEHVKQIEKRLPKVVNGS